MKHLLKLTSTHSPCSFVIAIAYECSRTAGGAIKISSRFPRLNWFATTSHWLDRVAWFSAEFTQLPWERNGERSLCVMSICSTVISYFFLQKPAKHPLQMMYAEAFVVFGFVSVSTSYQVPRLLICPLHYTIRSTFIVFSLLFTSQEQNWCRTIMTRLMPSKGFSDSAVVTMKPVTCIMRRRHLSDQNRDEIKVGASP